jgi:hypothetical protein
MERIVKLLGTSDNASIETVIAAAQRKLIDQGESRFDAYEKAKL